MKINRDDLAKGFQDFLVIKTAASRKNCPSVKSIIRLYKGKLSKIKRAEILGHILNCYYCSSDFKVVNNSIRFENELCQFIEKTSCTSHKKKDEFRVPKILHFKINVGKYQVVFVTLFIAILIISSFLVFHNKENLSMRGLSQSQLEPCCLIKKNQEQLSLYFEWKSLKKADYYYVEIFDDNLSLIWRSKTIFKNCFIFPLELKNVIKKNKKYYWLVTAFLINGKKIESKLLEFSL